MVCGFTDPNFIHNAYLHLKNLYFSVVFTTVFTVSYLFIMLVCSFLLLHIVILPLLLLAALYIKLLLHVSPSGNNASWIIKPREANL